MWLVKHAIEWRFPDFPCGYVSIMEPGDRSPEQDLASGRPFWTPFALLASVAGVIAMLFLVALILVVVAYVLA